MTGRMSWLDFWLSRRARLCALREKEDNQWSWLHGARLRIVDYLISRYGEEPPTSDVPTAGAKTDDLDPTSTGEPCETVFTAICAWTPAVSDEPLPPDLAVRTGRDWRNALRHIEEANAWQRKQYSLRRSEGLRMMAAPPQPRFPVRVKRVPPIEVSDLPVCLFEQRWLFPADDRADMNDGDRQRMAFICCIEDDIAIMGMTLSRIEQTHGGSVWRIDELVARSVHWIAAVLPGLMDFTERQLTEQYFRVDLRCHVLTDMRPTLEDDEKRVSPLVPVLESMGWAYHDSPTAFEDDHAIHTLTLNVTQAQKLAELNDENPAPHEDDWDG